MNDGVRERRSEKRIMMSATRRRRRRRRGSGELGLADGEMLHFLHQKGIWRQFCYPTYCILAHPSMITVSSAGWRDKSELASDPCANTAETPQSYGYLRRLCVCDTTRSKIDNTTSTITNLGLNLVCRGIIEHSTAELRRRLGRIIISRLAAG